MSHVPNQPKIYHITHLRNLPQIVAHGKLWSDAKRIDLGLECEIVGMSEIKRRRLEEIEVDCHPGTKVGYYVPFYFCPRSIILYILHKGNHPDITYRGGQGPIVHLQADLRASVEWAQVNAVRWAFSNVNAGAKYASFYDSLDRLDEVHWAAVQANDFRRPEMMEGKQAEFLLFESFPWSLVEGIGVLNEKARSEVQISLTPTDYKPPVSLEPEWYF